MQPGRSGAVARKPSPSSTGRRLLDKKIIDVVFADPEPEVFILQSDGESTILQTDPCGPNVVPMTFAELLELQGRVLRIFLQQGELLVGTGAHFRRQGIIIMPKIGVGAVAHDVD